MEKRTTGASLLRLADAFSTPFEQAVLGSSSCCSSRSDGLSSPGFLL